MNNTRNDILSKNTLKVNINITPSNNFVTNEAFKTLRSNLLFCGKNVKTIVVTSAVENEGKTTVSTELARGLAEISKKTLLIYGDMRKPATIKNRNVAGLAELLSGQAELAEVVYETQIPLLSVIFGGNIPPNPVELLSSEAFTDLLSQIKNEYDYIIIDSPPIVPVIDAAVISANCDGAILVIAAEKTTISEAKHAKEQLEKCNCRILGAVINQTKENMKSKYYNKKYYYYKSEKVKS